MRDCESTEGERITRRGGRCPHTKRLRGNKPKRMFIVRESQGSSPELSGFVSNISVRKKAREKQLGKEAVSRLSGLAGKRRDSSPAESTMLIQTSCFPTVLCSAHDTQIHVLLIHCSFLKHNQSIQDPMLSLHRSFCNLTIHSSVRSPTHGRLVYITSIISHVWGRDK